MTSIGRPPGNRRDLGFGQALSPLARPSLFVVVYRWRYEIVIVIIVLAGISAAWWAGPEPDLAGLAVVAVTTGLAATRPEFRAFVAARAWCIITPHRVRTCFAQAWVHNRAGQIPAVLRITAEPFGERVLLWCRAGTSFEDIDSVCDRLAAACWATEVIASRSGNRAQLVYLEVVRRTQWEEATDTGPGPIDSDVPSWPPPRERPGWRWPSDWPERGGNDAA